MPGTVYQKIKWGIIYWPRNLEKLTNLVISVNFEKSAHCVYGEYAKRQKRAAIKNVSVYTVIEQHENFFRTSLPTIDTVGLIKPKNISCYFPFKSDLEWLLGIPCIKLITSPMYIYTMYSMFIDTKFHDAMNMIKCQYISVRDELSSIGS
jgi:hypothetical protein